MAITFELSTRLADDSLEYIDGKIKLADALRRLTERPNNEGLDISDKEFTGTGVLTQDNFESALRAAAGWIYTNYDDTGYTPTQLLIPAGTWRISADNGLIVFLGTYGVNGVNSQGRTPGLKGAGESVCFIIIQGNVPEGRGMFEWGAPGGDSTFGVQISGITFLSEGGSGTGSAIRFREESLVTAVEHVSCFGFGAIQDYDSGFGIAFDPPAYPKQHQHLTLRNVTCQGNQTGLKLAKVFQLKADQLHLNQNLWLSGAYTDCYGSIQGGTMQDHDPVAEATPRANFWFGGALHPCAALVGWNEVVTSGTGATLGTSTYATDPDTSIASAGTCIVTDLTSMIRGYEGMWLYLSNGEAYGYGNIIRGLYQIKRWISATSVEIYKGTSHVSTGSLTWEVRASAAGHHLQLGGFPYHEGDRRCLFHIGPNEAGSAAVVCVDGLHGDNTVPVVAETSDSLELDLQNVTASGCPRARVQNVATLTTNQDVWNGLVRNGVIVDEYTRRGMSARSVIRRRSRNPNQLIAEMNGWSFAADRDDCVSLSTTNVTEWRSAQNPAVKFSPMHATQYCTFDAADAGFNGPAINILGGAAGATFKGLTCTIPAALLPVDPYSPTLILVGRFLTTPTTGGYLRQFRVVASDVSYERSVRLNDAGNYATGIYTSVYHTTLGGTATVQTSDQVTPNTSPFLSIGCGDYTEGYNYDGRIAGYSSRSAGYSANSLKSTRVTPGLDLTLELVREFDQITSNPVMVAWAGLVPYNVPPSEIDLLREALCNKYPTLPTL